MDLKTIRNLKNIAQLDIQKRVGIVQSKLSMYEKQGLDYLSNNDKEAIEKILDFKINWEQECGLTADELRDLKFFINQYIERHGEKKVFEWIKSFNSGQVLFKEVQANVNQNFAYLPPTPLCV